MAGRRAPRQAVGHATAGHRLLRLVLLLQHLDARHAVWLSPLCEASSPLLSFFVPFFMEFA